MDTFKRRHRHTRRRPGVVRLSQIPSGPLTPEMIEAFKSWGQVQTPVQSQSWIPQSSAAVTHSTLQNEKPIVEMIIEAIVNTALDVYKDVWKKTDPDSYNANQAIFALAPYWPSNAGWILNLGALGTALYGFGRVAERAEQAIEANKCRAS